MQLELIANGMAGFEDLVVLRAVARAERGRKDFVGGASEQLALAAASAALHQRLVDDDILAAGVLDEEDDIRQAVEQRLGGEGFREVSKQLGLKRHLGLALC